MIARFAANDASTDVQEALVVASVTCAESGAYLMFQRSLPLGGTEDRGVHVEYGDQSSSGYDKIKTCSLCRTLLQVELTEPIDRDKKYTAFEVELRLADADWRALAHSLRLIFADRGEAFSFVLHEQST